MTNEKSCEVSCEVSCATSWTEAAEFVLPGHPDKLCDAAADAIVDHVMRGDALGQCGVEIACVFDRVFVTGRIAAHREVLDTLDIPALVRRTYAEAGYGTDAAGHTWGPRPEDLRIDTALCLGEFEPGEREHRHRAGGMLARELALVAVKRAKREARVELRYEPGGAGPVWVGVWVEGRAACPGGLGFPDTSALASGSVSRRLVASAGGALQERARWGSCKLLADSRGGVRILCVWHTMTPRRQYAEQTKGGQPDRTSTRAERPE